MIRLLFLLGALALAPGFAPAQSTDFSKLVSAGDVEKVTGLNGVIAMPAPAPNDKMLGMVMFMANGKMIMMVSFAKPGTFVTDKTRAVAGVPDEAFESKDRSVLCFRKGNRPVMVQSPNAGAKPTWSPDQLKALAKVIYARM